MYSRTAVLPAGARRGEGRGPGGSRRGGAMQRADGISAHARHGPTCPRGGWDRGERTEKVLVQLHERRVVEVPHCVDLPPEVSASTRDRGRAGTQTVKNFANHEPGTPELAARTYTRE